MTMLTYTSLGEVPEGLRENATEAEDGSFTVKVAPQDRITEFRDKNIALSKERDEIVAKVARYETVTGVNLEEAEKLDDFSKVLEGLRETQSKVEAGVLLENTSLEEASQARITEVTNSLTAQIKDARAEADVFKEQVKSMRSRNDQMQVENAIRLLASDPDVGMLEKAVDMVLPRAYNVFKIEENGQMVPKMADGTIIYGQDAEPMTLKEWLLKERESNSFLFKGSTGGGASGGDQKQAGRLSAAELDKMSPQQRINYARKHGLV